MSPQFGQDLDNIGIDIVNTFKKLGTDLKNAFSNIENIHTIEYYKSIDELNNETDEEDMAHGVQCAQQ